jgi:hypothetical protein
MEKYLTDNANDLSKWSITKRAAKNIASDILDAGKCAGKGVVKASAKIGKYIGYGLIGFAPARVQRWFENYGYDVEAGTDFSIKLERLGCLSGVCVSVYSCNPALFVASIVAVIEAGTRNEYLNSGEPIGSIFISLPLYPVGKLYDFIKENVNRAKEEIKNPAERLKEDNDEFPEVWIDIPRYKKEEKIPKVWERKI